MTVQLQRQYLTGGVRYSQPLGFIAMCALAFFGGVWATAYFCHTMHGGMDMPGGWTMSMIWMRMNGHSWFSSAADFQLMWLAMMAAMMLPSAVPMFLKTSRSPTSLAAMAAGYFTVWQAVGAGIYVLADNYRRRRVGKRPEIGRRVTTVGSGAVNDVGA